MRVDDVVKQYRLLPVTAGRPAMQPVVVAGGRHLQHPADHRDREAGGGELEDHRERYFGSTFSRAK